MNIRPLCFLLPVAFLIAAPLSAQDEDQEQQQQAPALYGTVDENYVYTAPGGHYQIAAPVLPELGGTIQDTPGVVTFRDPYGVHVVIACLPFEDSLRDELTKRGRKDFLSWFFVNHIQPQYQHAFSATSAESAKYLPSVMDGTVLVMNLVPGGSAFADRVFLKEGEPVPVAKRGSLLFIKNDNIFVLSTELYERVLKRDTFHKTPQEEDDILRTRLLALLGKMSFPKSQPPVAAAPAPASPAAPAPAVPAK
jgi:hypothetical protein